MLKDNATTELIRGIDREFGAVDWIVFAVVFVGASLMLGTLPEGWPFFGLLGLLALSKLISCVLLYVLIAWLGRMGLFDVGLALSEIPCFERSSKRFLESWWQNEWPIKMFIVLFRSVFCLEVFRLTTSPVAA
jgi:hypothetical protein